MPTSTESVVAYVPRATVSFDLNEINERPRTVKNITADVEELIDVSPQTGFSTVKKVLTVAGFISVIAITIAVAVVLGITLSAVTTTTTISTTSTTSTTTSVTTGTTTTAMSAPTNMVAYRGNNGQSYNFVVTGSVSAGTIWGTTNYTDDSNLAVAAVHSGFVQNNQISTITVTILPGQSSYTSTTQNGITSNGYGSWFGSYTIISATG